jgi:hypothetical protein
VEGTLIQVGHKLLTRLLDKALGLRPLNLPYVGLLKRLHIEFNTRRYYGPHIRYHDHRIMRLQIAQPLMQILHLLLLRAY